MPPRPPLLFGAIYFCLLLGSLECLQTLQGQISLSDAHCHQKLGVANSGLVPFYWLYASDGHAFHGRLNQANAWESYLTPYSVNTKDGNYSWIQVDLHREMVVSGVLTQGNPNNASWVSKLHVWYSRDCERFTPILDSEGQPAIFHGNYDGSSVVTNIFSEVLVSRCIRVTPVKYEGNHTALRLELLGCGLGGCREAVIQHLAKEEQNYTVSHDFSDQHLQYPLIKTSLPTARTHGFAEFKFATEHLVFGAVFYGPGSGKSRERYIITFSRNCHRWKPIREKRGYGDPMVFKIKLHHFRSVWQPFPYPVRAHCVRLMPVRHEAAHIQQQEQLSIRLHFIGCCVLSMCGLHKRPRFRRVVGGAPSSAGQWPWLVSVRVRWPGETGFQHLCGGSLIHPQWVLTAAHCLNVMYGVVSGNYTDNYTRWADPQFLSELRLRLGDHSQRLTEDTEFDVGAIWAGGRRDYNATYYINDIALIKLAEPVRLTDHITTVCLPESAEDFPAGTECEVMGWGSIQSDGYRPPERPYHVRVPLVSNEACVLMYNHLTVTQDMLCAAPPEGRRDSCTGDSGGPLVCRRHGQYYQAGVVSWNIGCGLKGYPGVYSKVGYFADWIDEVVASV